MSPIVFLSLLIVYVLITIKIVEWTTSFILGDKLEVPELYFKYPFLYVVFGWAMLLALAVASFTVQQIRWYLCLLVLLVVRQLAIFFGQRKAFDTFRKGSLYLMHSADQFRTQPYSAEELEKLQADAVITNSQLKSRLKSNLAHRV